MRIKEKVAAVQIITELRVQKIFKPILILTLVYKKKKESPCDLQKTHKQNIKKTSEKEFHHLAKSL